MIKALLKNTAKKLIEKITDFKFINNSVIIRKFIPYKESQDSFVLSTQTLIVKQLDSNNLPVPPIENWLGYGSNAEEYVESGKKDIDVLISILKNQHFNWDANNTILDLGCGGGRMIRHLHQFSTTSKIFGTDINSNLIQWCKFHLQPPFNFLTNTTIPHLPFEDNCFDLIYTGSVFTHIDDLADAWFYECCRVLKPGAYLYATIHDEHSIMLLKTKYANQKIANLLETEIRNIPKENYLISIGRDNDSQVYYSKDYFIKTVTSIFDIVSETKEAYGYQTAYLLKKK